MTTDAAETPKRTPLRRLTRLLISAALLGAVAVGAGWTTSELARQAAERPTPEPTDPLPVSGVALEIEGGYLAIQRFVGRVEPARASDLAFERAGLVLEVLVDEGDRVAAGQLLARLDGRRLDAERARLDAELARIDADIALAISTRERQESLSADGFASGQRLDEAIAQVDALSAQRLAVEAQLEALAVDIERTELRAPFAGVVSARRLDPGAVVSPGTPALRLIEADRPQARIGLPPAEAAALDAAQDYPIEVAGVDFLGRLAFVRPDLNPATRTVDAVFDIAALDPAFAAAPVFGSIARLEIERAVEGRGAWAPLAALRAGENGLWRLLLLEPVESAAADVRRVARLDVRVERVEGARAFISGALPDGAIALDAGVNRIAVGQHVRLIDAGAILAAE